MKIEENPLGNLIRLHHYKEVVVLKEIKFSFDQVLGLKSVFNPNIPYEGQCLLGYFSDCILLRTPALSLG